MGHAVWISCDVGDCYPAVVDLSRQFEIRTTLTATSQPPDLIVASWASTSPTFAPRPEWSESAPPALLYLVAADDMGAVLREPLADPLADALLLPVRAGDIVLAIVRSLTRRDRYLKLATAVPAIRGTDAPGGLVGESAPLKHVIALARQVASSPATSVLLQGETGTGKELLARLIHAQTPGKWHRPFVDLNCAAIPSELLEAELFGFERGAFSHAARDKAGLMEVAHGGSLFLDEIGELNVGLQAKLLRALETGTFRRLGGVTERRSVCRVIASSNRNLLDAVQHGLFRLDLYHRLAVFTINTPPLRERRDDIIPIAMQFLRQFSAAMGRPATGFSPTSQALLVGYPYPGNVRELRNIIERALIVSEGPLITPKALGLELALMADTTPETSARSCSPAMLTPAIAAEPVLDESLAEKEREHIEQVLANAHGNRALAARRLRISVPTLYKKMRRYHLESVGR
jgi:two-component system response regulator AtoC